MVWIPVVPVPIFVQSSREVDGPGEGSMKILKGLLVGLVVLVAALVAVGFLMPSQYRVERTARINAPPERVYALLADPREWKRWSEWNRRDPAMKLAYSGPSSGKGAAWAWESKSEGDGRMTFTNADAPRRIEYALEFPSMGAKSKGALTLTADGPGTTVAWTNEGDVGRNPLMRLFVPFMDGMVGPDFAAGLANLKALVEKNA
jgi:uncharacterized protein YndB with AHSA1/START domain